MAIRGLTPSPCQGPCQGEGRERVIIQPAPQETAVVMSAARTPARLRLRGSIIARPAR